VSRASSELSAERWGGLRKKLVAHTGHGEVICGEVDAAGVSSLPHLLIVRIFPGLSPRGPGPATYAV
jgi:hypothetical protein